MGVEKVLPYRIFTMERCIFCVRAKMLMNKHGIEYNEKHLHGDGLEILHGPVHDDAIQLQSRMLVA